MEKMDPNRYGEMDEAVVMKKGSREDGKRWR